MRRYRFAEFTVSTRRRALLRSGHELPLIPRYFDLLVFLIERRQDAVHRRDIFDRVWTDVIVSDSALTQAIRTIRRTLGDDPREPKFIRTVSRHGYCFVCADLVEEEDAGTPPLESIARTETTPQAATEDRMEALLARLTRAPKGEADEEDRRDAAEMLHALGTTEALARLGTRPGHADARAVLRDTRWESAEAADVPIVGGPAPLAVGFALFRLRLRRAARTAALRWFGGALGAGIAGATGGTLGGSLLALTPGSVSPLSVVPVLATIGAACGATGGAGVAAGLSMAEVTLRSRRGLALVVGGAVGGAVVGFVVQWVARWTLSALVGLPVAVGGGLEGLVLGAAAGLGYALSTRGTEGLAAPHGGRRARVVVTCALCCGLAALMLTLADRPLVGGTVHVIASAAHSTQAELTPLGRLVGEPDFGPVARAVLGLGEGALFGAGLALGLTRRPSSGRSHEDLT